VGRPQYGHKNDWNQDEEVLGMKKLFAALLLFGLMMGMNVPTLADLNSGISPGDDTWVDINNSGTNKDATGLRADYSVLPECTPTRLVYLRFDLSSQVPDVTPKTKLRIYLQDPPLANGILSLWSTGDDWNGDGAGLGDETTLKADTAPDPISLINSQLSGISRGWIEFTGENLSNYLNSQKASHGGDDKASFVIHWQTCPSGFLADTLRFEDSENTLDTGNTPHIAPANKSLIFLPSVIYLSP
jgi:hypothetical protein